jgi:hypothetical protein
LCSYWACKEVRSRPDTHGMASVEELQLDMYSR